MVNWNFIRVVGLAEDFGPTVKWGSISYALISLNYDLPGHNGGFYELSLECNVLVMLLTWRNILHRREWKRECCLLTFIFQSNYKMEYNL